MYVLYTPILVWSVFMKCFLFIWALFCHLQHRLSFIQSWIPSITIWQQFSLWGQQLVFLSFQGSQRISRKQIKDIQAMTSSAGLLATWHRRMTNLYKQMSTYECREVNKKLNPHFCWTVYLHEIQLTLQIRTRAPAHSAIIRGYMFREIILYIGIHSERGFVKL